MESISVLGRGRQELSRHTHTLQSFSIDGEYNVSTANENLFIYFIYKNYEKVKILKISINL